MDRLFKEELERVPQGDLRFIYDDAQLEEAYQHCEEQFAHEFSQVIKKYGAIEAED